MQRERTAVRLRGNRLIRTRPARGVQFWAVHIPQIAYTYVSLRNNHSRACSFLSSEVAIEMEDPRYKVAAIEMEDSRCTGLQNGMDIQVEDFRCERLPNLTAIPAEDPRCIHLVVATEDPRCQWLHINW